jgi:hypothetical protein
MPDPISRTPIADSVRKAIADALSAVPDGKRGALLVIADASGPRAMLAARLNDHWKVAAGGGVPWQGSWVTGTVAVEASW